MFARRRKARPGFGRRSVMALGIALSTGSAGVLQADIPVFVQTQTVLPASYTVLSAPILLPTSYVVAPAAFVRYDTVPVSIVPTVTWLPGVTYVETAEWLPLSMPCNATTVIEAPIAGTTVTETPILSTPQSRAVEELPADSEKKEEKPAASDKPADTAEPPLTHGKETPPGLPELPGEGAKKPDTPAAAKPAESKPPENSAPAAKPAATKEKEEEIPPNLPPAAPANVAPADKKPVEAAPAKAVEPPPSIPLPTENQTKASAPVDPPPAAPAEESKGESLVSPGAPTIPLPDTPVPELSPVTPAAKPANDAPAKDTGKAATGKTSREVPEIPPPVEDSAPTDKKKDGAAEPVVPLPELPLPGELPPAKEVQDTTLKPVDPQAVKTGASKPAEPGKTQETSVRRQEVRRPVIESKPGGATEKAIAELDILVRSARSGSPSGSVQVYFRENGSGERFAATTDASGRARAVVPQGTWEVEVESVGGQRYVLGDVVSKSGRLTTVSGRDLPRLEIDR